MRFHKSKIRDKGKNADLNLDKGMKSHSLNSKLNKSTCRLNLLISRLKSQKTLLQENNKLFKINLKLRKLRKRKSLNRRQFSNKIVNRANSLKDRKK